MSRRPGPQLVLAGLFGALALACGGSDSGTEPTTVGPSSTVSVAATTTPMAVTSQAAENQTAAMSADSVPAATTPNPSVTVAPTPQAPDPGDDPATDYATLDPVGGEATTGYMALGPAIGESELILDRAHPFQSLDFFCVPYPPVQEEEVDVTVVVEHGDYLSRIADRYDVTVEELVRLNNIADPNLLFVGQELLVGEKVPAGLGPQAMGRGITTEAVTIVQLRTRLEELDQLGFGTETGDLVSMFKAFVGIVNDECWGLHGRRLDLRLVEASALGGAGVDLDTLRNAACLEATKSIPAVIVLNASGLAGTASHCITVDNQTAFVSSDPQPSSIVAAADGRLLSDTFGAEQAMELMVTTVDQAGLLDGQNIVVIAPDTPTQAQSVEIGLTDTLRRLGHNPAVHLIGCEGTVWCRTGLEAAVSRMAEQGVDVVFPTLNLVSLPELVVAMVASGVPKPLIVQSAFNQHGTDGAAELVLRYGGSEAARFYDGAVFVGHLDTGRHRLGGYSLQSFDEMCNDEYSRVTEQVRADALRRDDAVSDTVARTCAMVRYVARALYDAGPNPTRRAVHEALAALGPVDSPGMLPGSFTPGKGNRPDVVQVLTYEYPCRHGSGYRASGDEPGGCMIPTAGVRAVD